MPKPGPLVDTRIIRPAETALALALIGEIDLLRLKAIARLHARGLPPDVGWEDLLQETLTRERALMARQELEAIHSLFAGDSMVQRIMAGLGEGLSAEQIRIRHGISKTEYASARKRMRRCLLRQGLTCEPK